MTGLHKDLSFSEAKLLLMLDDDPHNMIPPSTKLSARYFERPWSTPYQRAFVLNLLYRLERRGLIERSITKRWSGGRVTQLGRTRSVVERVMPVRARKSRGNFGLPVAAIKEGRTVFPKRVTKIDSTTPQVLKPGGNNGKLGPMVEKGHYRGYAIYSLTLEERKTCPRSCERFGDCFGNNMSFAIRHEHGPRLEARLAGEVRMLTRKHPEGVLIRLHVLGDFYNVGYVMFWGMLLMTNPKLAVFGYTAHALDSEIGGAVEEVRHQLGYERFAIRHSTSQYLTTEAPCATWYAHGQPVPAETFACPEQTGRVLSCGECAACWQGQKTVAFALH